MLTKYLFTALAGFLTLALFDDNPWWLVFPLTLLVAWLNARWEKTLHRFGRGPAALGQAALATLLAYLAGLTLKSFRTTGGTLLGFAFLLTLGEFGVGSLAKKSKTF